MPVNPPVFACLLLAVAYAVAGGLGILLADSGSTEIEIWPAAGLALGVLLTHGRRLWPGIWLGSLIVNLTIHFWVLPNPGPALPGIIFTSLIAIGPALQALLAAHWLQPLLASRPQLGHTGDAARAMLIGGPLCCLIAASWGTLLLVTLGPVSLQHAGRVLLRWWTGDLLGVLIITPITLAWLGDSGWQRRRLQITLPLLGCLVLSGIALNQARRWEDQRFEQTFLRHATTAAVAVRQALSNRLDVLQVLRDLDQAVPLHQREPFSRAARGLIARHSGIAALLWLPQIDADTLAQPDTAASRLPILYIEPQAGHEALTAIDLAAQPALRTALERAVGGALAISPPPAPIRSPATVTVWLAVSDIDRQHGMLAAVLRLDQIIDTTLDQPMRRGLVLQLRDISAGTPAQPLAGEAIMANASVWRMSFAFGDRIWELAVAPNAQMAELRLHQTGTLLVLLACAFVSGVFAVFVLVASGRTTLVEAMVTARTAWLAREIDERKRAESRLRQAAIVYENTREGILVLNQQGRIEAVNPAFTQISGYGSELLDQRPHQLLACGVRRTLFHEIRTQLRADGHWQGETWNRHADGSLYPAWLTFSAVRTEDGRFSHYVAVFSDISSIKQSQAELERLAHHDPLTGLPNRLLLIARIEHAIARAKREHKRLALLFLDLDRFKNVNDSLGHNLGDRLLVAAAERLSASRRDADTLARLGGDEFVMLAENLAVAEHASSLAERLVSACARPFRLGEHELYLGTSIGIAVFPEDGEDAETLLRNADAAMYAAKAQGRGTFHFYTREQTDSAQQRVRIEAELRRALSGGELRLHYQPIVRLADGAVESYEALVRWQHPSRGLLLPAEFLAIAEESGLILELGHWVLDTACRQARAWLDAGTPRRVAVNITVPQVLRQDLPGLVSAALAHYQLPGHLLELELTESLLLQDPERGAQALKALKALGISLAVDDFGTGYSSLGYLKRLPIDRLKIDRLFVRDLPGDSDDCAIVCAIIDLAHHLHLGVLAEGVETAEQAQFLIEHGCELAQGWLYGRARSASAAGD
ncbi:EAL domain-containing protein [Plasticicumulans acidivorans]|uniref:PAS domain S-box-containing protein/diguanylate cyclase (GGDEF)-like protein n=1 Tax=Plasticicumulans acidivorans TaxID=886464 RepID=A0A317N083_9GAMM|nr:EAL domain-containing protein [Plasticicumulans acidivorans]PWV65895.1 PAS domain S-box-containing protein/diguanylate cyclase (GGDEF)-like protein [Plasticicumulans acidivorans]